MGDIMQLYRFYNRENMILWDTYVSVRYSPEKITETGTHKPCVMLTVGRAIKHDVDEEKIQRLPKRTRKEIIDKYTLETATKPNIGIKERIMNKIIRIYKKFGRVLGINLDRYENNKGFEIYQYIKFRDMSEIVQMVIATGILVGSFMRMKGESPDNNFILKIFNASIKKGYEKLGREA